MKDLWRKMAFDIAIFGADVPESMCDGGIDERNYSEGVSLPEPGTEDQVVATLRLDPEKGYVLVGEKRD